MLDKDNLLSEIPAGSRGSQFWDVKYALMHRPSSFTSIFILQENITATRVVTFSASGDSEEVTGLVSQHSNFGPVLMYGLSVLLVLQLTAGAFYKFFSSFLPSTKTVTQNSNPILRHEHITTILWKLFRVSRVNKKVHLLFGNCDLVTENPVHYILLTLYLAREGFHSFPIQIIDDNLEHEGARLINN